MDENLGPTRAGLRLLLGSCELDRFLDQVAHEDRFAGHRFVTHEKSDPPDHVRGVVPHPGQTSRRLPPDGKYYVSRRQ